MAQMKEKSLDLVIMTVFARYCIGQT